MAGVYRGCNCTTTMAPQMRGLTQFITDLRNSQGAEEERKRVNLEINNIQAKFGVYMNYQKKKYMCKLMYIHLMGYADEVAFAVRLAAELVGAADYAEKSLGYIAVSVLLNSAGASRKLFLHQLLQLMHPHLVRDLNAASEDVNCLALQFIASNYNVMPNHLSRFAADAVTISDADPGAQQWLDLADLAYNLCVSPIAHANTKRRAVVALLALLRLYPQTIVRNDNWIPRLLTLVDDEDPSVVLCAVPLATFLTDVNPSFRKLVAPLVVLRLHALVVERKCPEEYFYYETPAPWLAIALLQLVEHFFLPADDLRGPEFSSASLDNITILKLRLVVSKSIQNASKPVKGQSNRNCQSSILFQAVSITVYLDASHEAIDGAIHALIQLIDSTETNMRYLILDALIKIAARSQVKYSFDEYLDKIFIPLQDKDVSVRRKTLDLLYAICSETNYTKIISKFLDYIPVAEPSLKGDISVKVAVLGERYATDSIWYVSTMLRLLSISGLTSRSASGASRGEVWERIIQIIVNNEDLQRMACKYVINLLKNPEAGAAPESLVKVAAFILGEYGFKLDLDDPKGFSIDLQFQILYDAYFSTSLNTRLIIMSAMLKFIMRYPTQEFVPNILDLYEAETQSLDLETQTRAYEYLRVASLLVSGDARDVAFAQSLVRPLPPFELKKNKLTKQLGSITLISGRSSSAINVLKIPKQKAPGDRPSLTRDSLLSEEDPFEDHRASKPPPLSPNWQVGYHRMLQYEAGIFYEDPFIKLTFRTVKEGSWIILKFTIINNAAKLTETNLTAFAVHEIYNLSLSNYIIDLTEMPELTIANKTTMEMRVRMQGIVENKFAPIISMSYKCSGSFNTLNLKVPVVMMKTLVAAPSSMEDFKNTWLSNEQHFGAQAEYSGLVTATHRNSTSNIARTFQRLGFAIIHSTPDSEAGILVMCAGALQMASVPGGQIENHKISIIVKGTDQVGKCLRVGVLGVTNGVLKIVFDTISEIFEPGRKDSLGGTKAWD